MRYAIQEPDLALDVNRVGRGAPEIERIGMFLISPGRPWPAGGSLKLGF
jgi:hypothetical protein